MTCHSRFCSAVVRVALFVCAFGSAASSAKAQALSTPWVELGDGGLFHVAVQVRRDRPRQPACGAFDGRRAAHGDTKYLK